MPQDSDPFAIIAAPDVSQQTLSPNALRAIFSMRLNSWPSGEPIRVYVLRDTHPAHIKFCKQVLNIYPHQLRFAWDRQVFSGTSQAPRQVDSEEAMRIQVSLTPGAIGYLEGSMVNDSIRVIPIQ
jgi:ABC-type phosphate transport system substrate-binding protein